jgi:hypothetical protein
MTGFRARLRKPKVEAKGERKLNLSLNFNVPDVRKPQRQL